MRLIFDVSGTQEGSVSITVPELNVNSTETVSLSETYNVYSISIPVNKVSVSKILAFKCNICIVETPNEKGCYLFCTCVCIMSKSIITF